MRNTSYFLENSKGQKIELCEIIEHPKNQYSTDFEIINYANDADAEINQEGIYFTPFKLKTVFKSEKYSDFLKVENFIDYRNEMILKKYVNNQSLEYSRRIIFSKIDQTPVQTVELYEYEVEYTALSEWFTEEVIRIVPPETEINNYPYTYPFTYGGTQGGEVSIINEENKQIPLTLEIRGPSENPFYTLTNSLNEIVGQGRILENIALGETLIIETSRSTVEINGNNFYQSQDFTLGGNGIDRTFLTLPGEGIFTLRILQDNADDINSNVRFLNTRTVV